MRTAIVCCALIACVAVLSITGCGTIVTSSPPVPAAVALRPKVASGTGSISGSYFPVDLRNVARTADGRIRAKNPAAGREVQVGYYTKDGRFSIQQASSIASDGAFLISNVPATHRNLIVQVALGTDTPTAVVPCIEVGKTVTCMPFDRNSSVLAYFVREACLQDAADNLSLLELLVRLPSAELKDLAREPDALRKALSVFLEREQTIDRMARIIGEGTIAELRQWEAEHVNALNRLMTSGLLPDKHDWRLSAYAREVKWQALSLKPWQRMLFHQVERQIVQDKLNRMQFVSSFDEMTFAQEEPAFEFCSASLLEACAFFEKKKWLSPADVEPLKNFLKTVRPYLRRAKEAHMI
ncbi:MAG TPA: hypothetical protein PKO06_10910, partial [Candidatus Ozemobacteraceae bacterium]|nr:hypothetical protein [Candidatus Ozemobacteraceae bacterium]